MAVVTHSKDDRVIATTSSGLSETTKGEDDECMVAPVGPPKPFKNYALLKEAGDHSSERTKFADGFVISIDDAVGPPKGPPTHDEHPPYVIRKKGGPYQQEARATEGADNMCVEEKTPTRDKDPTTQDGANCEGIVYDLGKAEELAKMAADALKRCSLTEDKVECSHGRELGKVGENRVLEIVSDPQDPCMVLFEAKRHNAVEPGPPKCKLGEGNHTAWVIHRVAGGFLGERREERTGDVLLLDQSWTSTAPIPVFQAKVEAKDKKATPETEETDKFASKKDRDAEAMRRAKEASPERPKGGYGPMVGANRDAIRQESADMAKRNEALRERNEAQKKEFEAHKKANADHQKRVQRAAQLLNLAQFLRVYFWDRWPVRIDVTSQACTGGLQSQIVVYPCEEVDFKLSDKDIAALKIACKAVTTFAEWLSAICQRFMRGFKVEIVLLKDPEIEIKCRWLELDKDAPDAGRKKYQVGRKQSLMLKLKKIVGIKVELPVPWARIVDAAFPGAMAGTAMEYILSWIGAEAAAGLGVTLDIGVEGGCSQDQYGVFEAGNVNIVFDFKFYVYVRIVFRSNLNIEVQAVARWNPKFKGFYRDPDAVAFFKLDKGDARIGFTGYVVISTFWWERKYGGEVWPEFMRYKYEETDLHPIKYLMALSGK
jgi:hypothetical protein